MKPSTRWTIAVVAVILIAMALWLWMRRDEPQAPAAGEVAVKPEAPKPEPKPEPAAPVKPVVEEPLTTTVLFDFDRAEVRPGEVSALDDFAARLKGRSYDRLEIVGHADRIGGDKYNLALAQRRAAAVRDYLAGRGVDAKRVRADAVGEAQPVTGDTCKDLSPANRKNRKLIECLQPDRRAELRQVAKP
ncbi:MAG: OmpA family protein [Geminicoccales bacterium]